MFTWQLVIVLNCVLVQPVRRHGTLPCCISKISLSCGTFCMTTEDDANAVML
jgi:hypothetical protein